MAEPVRPIDEDVPSRTALTAVADLERAVPSLGRWAGTGALLGFLVVTAAIAAVAVSQDIDVAAAVGLGVAVGIFGGAGFGCMVGSVLALARREVDDG
jgi:hypothetical protein